MKVLPVTLSTLASRSTPEHYLIACAFCSCSSVQTHHSPPPPSVSSALFFYLSRNNRKTKECECNRQWQFAEKRLHRNSNGNHRLRHHSSTKIKENNDKIGSTPPELIAKHEIHLLNRKPHTEKRSENFCRT